MPGLVSTLLNQAYSMPSRLVHTFLQVTEQVWHPMHLSRFSTMAICARIFMCVSLVSFPLPIVLHDGERESRVGRSSQSTLAILRTITNSSRLVPMVPE